MRTFSQQIDWFQHGILGVGRNPGTAYNMNALI